MFGYAVRLTVAAGCAFIMSCGDAYDDGAASTVPAAGEEPQPDAGSTSATPPALSTPSLSGTVQPIFTANCSCHTGPLPAAGQNLESGKAFTSIVGVQSAVGSCRSLKRIDPGKPDDSAMIKRLEGTTCGIQMPKGRTPLSSDLVSQIRKWVESGALNN